MSSGVVKLNYCTFSLHFFSSVSGCEEIQVKMHIYLERKVYKDFFLSYLLFYFYSIFLLFRKEYMQNLSVIE